MVLVDENKSSNVIDYNLGKKYFGRISIVIFVLFIAASMIVFLPLGTAAATAAVMAPLLNVCVGFFDTLFYYLKRKISPKLEEEPDKFKSLSNEPQGTFDEQLRYLKSCDDKLKKMGGKGEQQLTLSKIEEKLKKQREEVDLKFQDASPTHIDANISHKQRQRWFGVFSAVAWSLAALASIFVPGGIVILGGIGLAHLCHAVLAVFSGSFLFSYYRRYYSKHHEKVGVEKQEYENKHEKQSLYIQKAILETRLDLIKEVTEELKDPIDSRTATELQDSLAKELSSSELGQLKRDITEKQNKELTLLEEKNKFRLQQVKYRKWGGGMSFLSATILLAGVAFPLFGVGLTVAAGIALVTKIAAVICSSIGGISLLRAEGWYAIKKQKVVEDLQNTRREISGLLSEKLPNTLAQMKNKRLGYVLNRLNDEIQKPLKSKVDDKKNTPNSEEDSRPQSKGVRDEIQDLESRIEEQRWIKAAVGNTQKKSQESPSVFG